jgi:hypothetical protein
MISAASDHRGGVLLFDVRHPAICAPPGVFIRARSKALVDPPDP